MVEVGVLCISVVKALSLNYETYIGSSPFLHEGLFRYEIPLQTRRLFQGLAQGITLSRMQICHIISLWHLCAKPVSILLQTWRCKSPPTPAVSYLFILYYSAIWFVICSHCLLKTCFKTYHNHIYRVLGIYFPSIWIIILQIRKTDWTCLRRKEVATTILISLYK